MDIKILQMFNLQPMIVKYQADDLLCELFIYIDLIQERVFDKDGLEYNGDLKPLILNIIQEKKRNMQTLPVSEDVLHKVFNANKAAGQVKAGLTNA